jgi:WD40 repeat protein
LIADQTKLALWDLSAHEEVFFTRLPTWCVSIALSPDGRIAALGHYRAVYLVDAARGRLLEALPIETLVPLHFTPDSRHLIAGGQNGTLRIWSMETFAVVARIQPKTCCTDRVDVSPDGLYLVTGGTQYRDPTSGKRVVNDCDVHLWELPNCVWPRATTIADIRADRRVAGNEDSEEMAEGESGTPDPSN